MGATACSGAATVILGFLALLSSIATLALSSTIVSFYTVIGGILCCLAEAQFGWFLSRATLFQSRIFRGFFYIFIGSLTFAVFGFESILGILLIVTGAVLMIAGGGQVVFSFFANDAPVDYHLPTGGYSGAELGESSFNPDDYATSAYSSDPASDAANAYSTYEDSLSPMQYAEAATQNSSSSAYGTGSNYSAYESF